MKKLVANVLVVSAQLMIGVLFLCILFSNSSEGNRVVVVENDNLNKMADSVSNLFKYDRQFLSLDLNDVEEIELGSVEEFELDELEEDEVEANPEVSEEVVQQEEAVVYEPVVEEPQEIIVVDPTGYISNSSKGFNVTTDNRTYSMSESDAYAVSKVVACEAKDGSRDDILAVISVILNRAEYRGVTPVSEVSAGGFSCWGTSKLPSDLVISVVNDAFNGIRNNSYTGFRSWTRTSYSDNYIVDGGNRYGSW